MIFEIHKEIFDHFSGLRVVTVLVDDMPGTADKEAIAKFLDDAWQIAAAAAVSHGNAQSHPNILPWVEGMKAVGVSRKKFPSSIESMVRRAGKSDEPFRINPIVDFYNAVSLKHIVPAGGYDMDDLHDTMALRMSADGDTFCALDEDTLEPIPAGEVSYTDGSEIITRHFVWKQSRHALLKPETKKILFVSEILSGLPEGTAEAVAADFVNGLRAFFGVEATAVILDSENRSV